MQERFVRDLMSQEVLCSTPGATATELVALMHEHAYSCILITEGERPVGIVTERDVVSVLDGVLKGDSDGSIPASEFMSEASHDNL